MDSKKIKIVGVGLLAAFGLSSCATTYDPYGRPVTTVDPAAATIGALAIGAAAYSVGKNNRKHKRHYYTGHYNGGYGHRYYAPSRCSW